MSLEYNPVLRQKLQRAHALLNDVSIQVSKEDFWSINEIGVLVNDAIHHWGTAEWDKVAAWLTEARDKLHRLLEQKKGTGK